MTRCSRCGRTLRAPVIVGGVAFGSTCARHVAGVKPKRRKPQPVRVDDGQGELFKEQTQ